MYTKTEEIITQTKEVKTVFKKLMDWQGNSFESSCYKTDEFKAFSRMFRSHVKQQAKINGLEVVNFNVGHFYISGFLFNKITNKYVYFSISDVRFFKDSWIDDVLIRTAQHAKDYTGGMNQSCHIQNIGRIALEMTE